MVELGRTQDFANLVRMDEGLLSARVVWDPAIFELERERIFGRRWLFIGHDSELPRAGDYVARRMGEDPVIAWRGPDGAARVFLNACRHRGRTVCAEDFGRAARLRCPYHGWTYDSTGALAGVPFLEAYQGRLDQSNLGLLQAPRVESYHGLIFANWDQAAPSLVGELADMAWVLDILFGRSDAVEVVGPPIRWEIPCNWKPPACNFAGDGYHLGTTHGFSKALNLRSTRGERVGHSIDLGNGHTCAMAAWAGEIAEGPYLALPEAIWPEIERHLTPVQQQVMRPLQTVIGNVFPNLSLMESGSHPPGEWAGPEGLPISFLSLRQWQPLGPDRIEAWSWLFVDRNAPDEWKATSRACYTREFGPAGIFEQDDVQNWASITQSLRAPHARNLWHHYELAPELNPSTGWLGPGKAYRQEGAFSELAERAFYRRWLAVMEGAAVGR